MALRPDSTPRFSPKGRDVHACGTVETLNAFVLENPQLFERSLPYIQVRVLEQEGGGTDPTSFSIGDIGQVQGNMTDTTGPISISLSYDAGSDLNVCNLDIRVRLPPETRIEWLAHLL